MKPKETLTHYDTFNDEGTSDGTFDEKSCVCSFMLSMSMTIFVGALLITRDKDSA